MSETISDLSTAFEDVLGVDPNETVLTADVLGVDPNETVLPVVETETQFEQDAMSDSAADVGDTVLFENNATVSIDGGRVTTLELDTDRKITSIEIIDAPARGNLTVNPDNSLALVLSGSDYSGSLSFDFKVIFANGDTETKSVALTVAEPQQEAGWGQGKHYMLEVNANGDLIVETGDNHRKVYVSESDDALSRADIATLEGLAESEITQQWLLDNPEYGGSEGMALDTEAGMEVWYGLTPNSGDASSHWLLFEKGYQYEDTGRLINGGVSGEDPLHPVRISSWGDGDRPILNDEVRIFQIDSQNIVMDDITFTGGLMNLSGSNIILSDTQFTEHGMNIQFVSGFTLRDSDVHHVVVDKPDGDYWTGTTAGFYAHIVDGLLLDGNTFHHNGWEDDYLQDGSTDGGMAPNMFSHNVYLQNTTTDVTFRDNIVSQGSSYGAQIRGGGFVEGNVFVDNNAAVTLLGGVYQGEGPIGNFSFFTDNVITSGAHKTIDGFIGGLTLGLTDSAFATTLLDNIIAHLADPDNPDELAERYVTHPALTSANGTAYDDTIIYNWVGSGPDDVNAIGNNTPGLDEALADQTTIQNFAAALLGDPDATIAELVDHIISLGDTVLDDSVTAKDIVAYFQSGFGIDAGGDSGATAHTFVPNALADGIRWDNRINWDTEKLPDTGDSVILGGNWVQYSGTTYLNDLDLGANGRLAVNSGKLSIEGQLSVGAGGARVETLNAGQFWINGYSDKSRLIVNVEGGRFANTGDITGQTRLNASEGQTLLATNGANYILNNNSKIQIKGSDAKIGFDGSVSGDLARLTMEDGSLLTFASDLKGFSTIKEFHSGLWDDPESQVNSHVTLNGTLRVDLTNYDGGAATHTLIKADVIAGTLDDVDIIGLNSDYDAKVVTNYNDDTLTLKLMAGSGQITVITTSSSEEEASQSLTGTSEDDALTGASGNDVLVGKGSSDVLDGDAGDDLLMGNSGHDKLSGQGGQDYLNGGIGRDALKGGKGGDQLNGGNGSDILKGGSGADLLSGGKHADTLIGNAGNDTFHFEAKHGRDTIVDFEIGSDILHLDFSGADFDNIVIKESENDTVIDTGEGRITLLDVKYSDLTVDDFLF